MAAAARALALAALAAAATARNRRRDEDVLLLESAWAIWLPFWLGLEPGRKVTLPLGLLFVYTNNHDEAIKNCTQKIKGTSGRQ
jgi:hypothetical protein